MPMPPVLPMPPALPSESFFAAPLDAQDASYLAASARMASFWRVVTPLFSRNRSQGMRREDEWPRTTMSSYSENCSCSVDSSAPRVLVFSAPAFFTNCNLSTVRI